ncbi:hypothetical protein H4582DRAFT_2096011 [Lactarius indigo]|nr:hypothetical protein H4582DRAFT_2096011 [Lactarius indigo]
MPGHPVVDIRNSFGAAFFGLLVSTTLFGLTVVQAWIYYWRCWNKDRKTLKFFIGFLLVTEAFHTILCAYAIYWYLILNFGNVENLQYNMWALTLQTMISAIPGTAVQLYYARRIYLISRNIFFPIVIAVLLLGGHCLGYYVTAKEFVEKRFSAVHNLYWWACVGMIAAVLVDILVAAVMCWSLYRKKTGFARTDSMIMTLMAYTINSGLLTSLLGTAMTVSVRIFRLNLCLLRFFLFYDQFVVAPSSMIPVSFLWIMGKCYLNSLLAMLNSRDHVREQSSAGHPNNAFNLSSIRIQPPSEAHVSKSKQPGVSVTVHRSTASDFAPCKSDHNVGPTIEVSKPDITIDIIPSQGQSRTSESSA